MWVKNYRTFVVHLLEKLIKSSRIANRLKKYTSITLYSSHVGQLTNNSLLKKVINSNQSKSSFDIVNLLIWGEQIILKKWRLPSFLKLNTFKIGDLISYRDSRQNLLKCSKMITWLRAFIGQLNHIGDECRVIEE